MINNYWVKDHTRQEIITKTQIPNNKNFKLFANYYNFIDKKGLNLQLNFDFNLPNEKLFRKNGFEYFILEHNGNYELIILPNKSIEEYINRVIKDIYTCDSEIDVLNLLIQEM